MNIVKPQLKQSIKEEIKRILSEEEDRRDPAGLRMYRRDAEGNLLPAAAFYEPFEHPPGSEAATPDENVTSPLRGVEQGRLGMLSPERRAELQRMQQQGYDFESETWPEQRTPEAISRRDRGRERAREYEEAYLQGDEALADYVAQREADQPGWPEGSRRPATAADIERYGGPGGHEVLPGIVMRAEPTPPEPAMVATAERETPPAAGRDDSGQREQEQPLAVAGLRQREPAPYASTYVPIGGEQAGEYATSLNEMVEKQIDRYLNNIK